MTIADSMFVRQTVPISTIEHRHIRFNENGCIMRYPNTGSDPGNDDSVSVSSDAEQECSHDIEEDAEDDEDSKDIIEDEANDGILEQEEKDILGDTHSGCLRCVAHQRCTLDCGQSGTTSHNAVNNNEYFDCKKNVPDLHEETALETTRINKPIVKPRSRLRDFAGKAKEHLRDEENRKKAVEIIQGGVREVTAFIAEVQASDKAGGRSDGAHPIAKGNGKKIAKVCTKVAMQRLAK